MKRKLVLFIQRIFKRPLFEKLLISALQKFQSVSFIRKFAPQNYEYAKDEIRICNRYGINYKLYIQDYQSWLLYFYCSTDSSFGLLKNVKKDDTVIDVGGNIGQTAMMLSKQVGNNGKVISFEPFQRTYQHFIENLSLNKNITNITVECMGLGEHKDTLYMLEECSTNSGGTRIANSPIGELQRIPVQVITLDEYVSSHHISKINFIKIDVEGFELKVLKGAANTLKLHKPYLHIEIDDHNLRKQNDTAQSMINYLLGFDYEIFDAETSLKISNYTEMSLNSRDIFCKPIISITT